MIRVVDSFRVLTQARTPAAVGFPSDGITAPGSDAVAFFMEPKAASISAFVFSGFTSPTAITTMRSERYQVS